MTVTTAAAQRWAAHLWVPSGRRGSHVDDVAEISALMRAPLEDWQLEAVDTLTAYGRGGVPLALESCLIVPRQNGKTYGVMRPIAVTECLFGVPSLSTWTAQLKDTLLDTFNELKALMGRQPDGIPYDEEQYVPELGQYVVGVSDTDSAECLSFANGSELAFRVRSARAGRGKRPRRLYGDEALFMTGEEAAAIVPGMARQGPTAGILYGSSACLATSEYLHELVSRGRRQDPDLLYVEHCAPGSFEDPGCEAPTCDHGLGRVGCAADRAENWAAANPAYRTGAMTESYMRGARKALKEKFPREHLGWHQPLAGSRSPFTVDLWKRAEDLASAFVGPPAFGLAVSRDSASAAIAAAGWREDGEPHVETVAYAGGDGWLLAKAEELDIKHQPLGWALDEKTAAGAHVASLKKRGIRLQLLSTTDAGKACADLLQRVKQNPSTVRHRGEKDPHLQTAALGAQRRDVGPGLWVWAPKDSEVDTVPLEAATWALYRLISDPAFAPWAMT